MANTPESFDLAAHQCYRRIEQSLRVSLVSTFDFPWSYNIVSQDLEDHTAQVRAETIKLKRALDNLRRGIPRENEAHPHQAHTQHNHNVRSIRRALFNISANVRGLRDSLQHHQNEVQAAMDRVLRRVVDEMPSWALEIHWRLQHHP